MPAVIDEQHRPKRQEFHRLLDRIGRRARYFGDDRNLLPRERVQQRRLACVPTAENADVQAESFGSGLHHDLTKFVKKIILNHKQ